METGEGKEDHATEKRPSPGEAALDLKSIREARGLSLHAIFETTRVSPVNLAAVENGDYLHLPPPVYARNFIRKYARAIGTDDSPILDRYERYLASLQPQPAEMKVRKPWPEDDRRYRFLFLSLGVVIAAGILVLALFLYDQADRAPSPPVQDAAVPAQVAPVPLPEAAVAPAPAPAGTGASAVSPATEALPPPGKAPAPDPASREVPVVVAMPPAPAAGKQYHLVIEARELTWLRITEDRNPPYQVLLKQGDRIERMASDHFQLDIGNAGGIQLVFQGKPLGVLGKQGQIIHMRLPEKGVERKP